MEALTLRAPTRLVFLLLLLPLCHSSLPLAPSTLCQRPRLEDSIFVDGDQCCLDHEDEFHTAVFASRGVSEVNGTDLERSLQLLNTRESMYAAVLVYARWCPFSRTLVPVFDSLASTFPSIYHFAVEEAALRPSAYSYYGVHSFPVLFFHNKTAKVRYQGSRTYEAITRFYRDISGIYGYVRHIFQHFQSCEDLWPASITRFYRDISGFEPVLHRHETANGLKVSKRGELGLSARVLEKRKLQEELYLIFSFIFLVSRVLFYLLPRAMNVVKQQWAEKFLFWKAHRTLLRRVGKFEQKRDTNATSKSIKGKSPKTDFTQETGKVLLSVPGWPSSSLAPVSLAEGSSSKAGAKEDVRDNGHVFKNYLWG